MPVDFSKIISSSAIENLLPPRDIFMALPGRSSKYSYPRDVQSDVWTKWFDLRNNRDNIIKMNTGSGKTVVGMLILKSCLNEKKYPAVYVVPDPYLVNQVIEEANLLGIAVTNNDDDIDFRRGKSILVINIHKLIHGFSAFGMRSVGNNIKIGSILIDDAHACINAVESQFTLEIKRDDYKYGEFFKVLEPYVKQQSDTKVLDLNDGVPNANIMVPFWGWQDNVDEFIRILHKGKDDDDIKYRWPLLSDCLKLCNCVVASERIEISAKSIPIHKIKSFFNAERRIFMSATLADDSILVSHFDVEIKKILKIITPDNANDIGDRLIIVPQAINSQITDDELKIKFKELSQTYNVVVIVPSNYRARYWDSVADRVLIPSTLHYGVNELKEGHVGLVVIINRYEGIDLPEDACRVLVIDGLPDTRSEFDKIEQGALSGSERIINNHIQRVEQGMGRGVRSNNDYCVVFLMGNKFINLLYGEGEYNKFSNATKAQMELSDEISSQMQGQPIDEIIKVSEYSLKRDKTWTTLSKNILSSIKYDSSVKINEITLANREAFNYAEKREYEKSVEVINELVNRTENKQVKGWLKQFLAEYRNLINPIDAQEILKSALKENIQVMKPIEGIQYQKRLSKFKEQGLQFIETIKEYNYDENKFIMKIKALIDDLEFKPNTADDFENAFMEAGLFIGFDAFRPEKEYRRGPDDVWTLGDLNFLIIECKNGVTTEFICKHDCNQMNGSIEWFKGEYDGSCQGVPIIIHPSNIFDFDCSPNKDIKIMNAEKLSLFKENLNKFSVAVVNSEVFNNAGKITELLVKYNFAKEQFFSFYTVEFKVKPRS